MIVLVALGTRGDVQPLSLLAWQLRHGSTAAAEEVTFITHQAHQAWLEELLGRSAVQLQLLACSSPAAVWQHSLSGNSDGAAAAAAAPAPATGDPRARSELLGKCCTALRLPLPSAAAASAETHAPRQAGPETPGAVQQQQRLLLFNLFALEVFHIAEAVRVPCMVAQPYLIPYPMPAAFGRRLARAAPGLTAALQQAQAAAADTAVLAPQHPRLPPVSWKDVSHWMWPLFTERWGSWRQELLGLPSWPLLQPWQQAWEGCTCPHLGSCDASGSRSNAAAGGRACEPSSSSRNAAAAGTGECLAAGGAGGCNSPGGSSLPEAIPVLYGLSPAVVTRPGFWPPAVQLTGCWLVQDVHVQPTWQQQQQQHQQQLAEAGSSPQLGDGCCRLPPELQQWLAASRGTQQQQPGQQEACSQRAALSTDTDADVRQQLLLVDFGSMGCLGLIPQPWLLLQVLLAALELLGWRGVLLTGGWQPLRDAHASLLPQQAAGNNKASSARLFVQHASLACHHLLLEAAAVVLHHGGSGTTAAALAAGTPQLICPLQFDQFFWAEKVSDLGCCPGGPLSINVLLPAGNAAAAHQQAQQQPAAAKAADDCCVSQWEGAGRQLGQEQQQQQQQCADSTVEPAGDAPAGSAVQAAAAALAAQVLAARQQRVRDCCQQLKQATAGDSGLAQAAALVLQQHSRLIDPVCGGLGLG